MESGGSLPCSQKPTTSANPEPNQFSPHPSHPTARRFIALLYSYLCHQLGSAHQDTKEKMPYVLTILLWNRVGDNTGNMSQQPKIRRLQGVISNVTLHFSQHAPRSNLFALPYLASALQRFLPAVKRLLIWSCACQNVLEPLDVFSPAIYCLQENVVILLLSDGFIMQAKVTFSLHVVCLCAKHKGALVW